MLKVLKSQIILTRNLFQPVSTCFNVFQEEQSLVTLIESIAQSIDIIDLECMIEPYQGAEYRLGSACDAWCTT
jgi:hypothetical protein